MKTEKEKQRSKVVETFLAARRAGAPIVAISTADQHALQHALAEAVPDEYPKLTWNAVNGLQAINDPAGLEAIAQIGDPESVSSDSRDPANVLIMAARLPKRSVVIYWNAHRWIGDATVAQAILNLRDIYKADFRTLVLIGPALSMPAELVHDVVLLEDPLPDEPVLEKIVRDTHQSAGVEAPEDVSRHVDAVRGLSAFEAEQVVAMSMKKKGLQLEEVWDRKRSSLEQTAGVRLNKEPVLLEDLRGLATAREYARRLFTGRKPPRAVFFVDEIEKSIPNGENAGSHVEADALGVLLKEMADCDWQGMIAFGPPGSGKTRFAMGLGGTFGVPVLMGDIGATRGMYVGQSEQGIRDLMRVVKGVGGDRVFVVGTSNRLGQIPSELVSRFTAGIWMFDIPTAEEREAIWSLYVVKYGLEGDVVPESDGWTGREIRNCCRTAWTLKCTLREASAYVVPVVKSNPEAVRAARETAHMRFLSASSPGVYLNKRDRAAEKAAGRKIEAV